MHRFCLRWFFTLFLYGFLRSLTVYSHYQGEDQLQLLCPLLSPLFLATMDVLATTAGLVKKDCEHLEAQGYTSVAVLARAARSDDEFIKRVVEPYVAGVTIGSTAHKSTCTIIEARLLVAFEEAKRLRSAEIAAAAAPPAPAAAPLSATSSSTTKVILDPATYQRQIDNWESSWTPKRSFPEKLIQGADVVLWRLLDERNITRAYTPLHLSEVIQSRAHNTDGSINLERVEKPRRDERVVLTSAGVELEHATPDPLRDANRWQILDAIDANGWALRWAGYISDDVAFRWSAWLSVELRGPDSTELFKLFYLSCNWRISFALRSGRSYDQEVKDIMQDDEWVRKTKNQIRDKANLLATTAKAGFPKRSRSRHNGSDRLDGPPKRQDTRKRSRSLVKKQPPKPIRLFRSRSRGGSELCKNFNKGKCKNKGSDKEPGNGRVCNYSHECGNCGKKGCVGQVRCTRGRDGR